MLIYLAGIPHDKGFADALKNQGVRNILCSYARLKGAAALHYAKEGYYEKDMILYCAGNMNEVILGQMAERTGALNWLETNAHKGSRDCAVYFAKHKLHFRIFIDSGAFTAWVKGTPIDLDGYIQFCKELLAISEEAHGKAAELALTGIGEIPPAQEIVFAALDVIAGSRDGGDPTEAEFEASSKQGWENYLYMKAKGIQSIPTFHQGDPWHWLDLMSKETDYIALSPRKVGKTTLEKAAWLTQCFKRLGPRAWSGELKVHGLGISSPPILETYPFYSVDSTRWLHMGGGSYSLTFNGARLLPFFQTEWKKQTSYTMPAIEHYKESGMAKLVYWYHELGMRGDAELEGYITRHWEARGVYHGTNKD